MTKIYKLQTIIKSLQSVVIAYSGGLDSTFLLKAAIDALGRKNVIAVTARSETYPLSEYKEARRLAKKLGARHITIHTEELFIPHFRTNPVNRCYYCKKELFSKLIVIAKQNKLSSVLEASNLTDKKDYRPGNIAKKELGIKSPLLEAGFSKEDIVKLSKKLGLSSWN